MLEFNTIHWLPRHLSQMTEWQEICKAYDYLLSQAYGALDEFYANQFLESLTELGCLIWEKLLSITPADGSTIEERRQAIIGRLASDLPYTENKLRESLEAVAGSGNVTLTVTQETYGINVELTISSPSVIEGTQEIVYKMRPANMTVRIGITYKKTDHTYVGMAYKSTKTVTPTDKTPVDPVGDVTLFVYGNDLLTDSYKSPLKDAKEA